MNPKLVPKSKQQKKVANISVETADGNHLQCNFPSTSEGASTTHQVRLPRGPANNEDTDNLPSSQWSSRNRPIISTLASSELSKKYNKLADLKIEIAILELEKVRSESDLRKKSLELDIQIKQSYLQKIESSSNPFNFYPHT